MPLTLTAGRTSCIVNGVDLSTLRLSIDRTEGLWDHASINEGLSAVPARAGSMWDGTIEAEPRTVTLTGWIRGTSLDNARDNVRAVRRLLDKALLEVIFVEHTTAAMIARRSQFRATLPKKFNKAARFELALTSHDAWIHEVSDRVYQITTARTQIPLGLGPSAPIIRINGPGSNPLLVNRSITGEEVARIGFTVTLLSDQYIEVNCQTQECTLYDEGAAASPIQMNDDSDFFSLDPRHGRAADNSWGTLECSLESEVQLRRTW